MGHPFTKAEHTLTKPSIIGTWPCGGPWGLYTRDSLGSVPSKIVYSSRSSPVTLSTQMRTLAMLPVLSTSVGYSWDFPLVNAGITNSAFFRPTLCNSEPLSDFPYSHATNVVKIHNSLQGTCQMCPPPSFQVYGIWWHMLCWGAPKQILQIY